jgi:hypothetical protein
MVRQRIIRLTVVMWICAFILNAGQLSAQSEGHDERRQRLNEYIESIEPVEIYGLVLDEEGQSIPSAAIKLSWIEGENLKPNRGQTEWVRAGKKGRWSFTATRALIIDVMEVRKEGYEFKWEKNPYFSELHRTELIRNTSKDNPLLLYMRKKGDTTFLLRSSGNLLRAKENDRGSNFLDLIQRKKQPIRKKEHYVDLDISAEFLKQESGWELRLETKRDGSSGIIASDELLFIAPLEGYKPEVVLVGPDYPRYIYLRSRQPAIVTRLDLRFQFHVASPSINQISIYYDSWTNPYGSRNLEYDQALTQEWRLEKRLKKEAKKAIKEGHLAKEPDLKKLIKEEKEKRQ